MSIYTDKGYKDRNDYLKCLANESNLSLDYIMKEARLLGQEEDFGELLETIDQILWEALNE